MHTIRSYGIIYVIWRMGWRMAAEFSTTHHFLYPSIYLSFHLSFLLSICQQALAAMAVSKSLRRPSPWSLHAGCKAAGKNWPSCNPEEIAVVERSVLPDVRAHLFDFFLQIFCLRFLCFTVVLLRVLYTKYSLSQGTRYLPKSGTLPITGKSQINAVLWCQLESIWQSKTIFCKKNC